MSEQQVLPELDTFHYLKADEDLWQMYERHLRCRERQLSTALASLAQSEAERERLQESQEFWKSGWYSLDHGNQILLADLARERERNQELRQVVKECSDALVVTERRFINAVQGWTVRDMDEVISRNAGILDRSYSLLEPQPAPVATGEK